MPEWFRVTCTSLNGDEEDFIEFRGSINRIIRQVTKCGSYEESIEILKHQVLMKVNKVLSD